MMIAVQSRLCYCLPNDVDVSISGRQVETRDLVLVGRDKSRSWNPVRQQIDNLQTHMDAEHCMSGARGRQQCKMNVESAVASRPTVTNNARTR